MPYFESEQQVYEHLGKLFQDASADEAAFGEMRHADAIVQFRLRQPDAQITVSMLVDAPPQVDLGPTHLRPDIVFRMDTDTAHRFFLGRVNVTMALSRRQMSVDGPVDKILRLVPISAGLVPRYTALLESAGREDLVAETV